MINNEIEVFKGFLEIEERSPHTIRQYMSIMDWFQQFLDEFNLDFNNLSENDIVKFQLWLKKNYIIKQYIRIYKKEPTKEDLITFEKENKGLNGKSMYKYLTTIKKFLEVNDKGLNWTKIPSPKYDDNFNPDVLSPEEIVKIADVASSYCTFQHAVVSESNCMKCNKYRSPKNKRSAAQRNYPDICFYFDGIKLKAMLRMAYEAALRTDELCNLKVKHIDLKKKEVFIEKPLKHSQPQAIPISDDLTKLMKDYLERHRYLNDKEDILFPTKTGKKYHPNNFATHVFRPIAKTAGFDIRYYTLRHSRATNLLKQGLDIGWVRRITRHRNINNVLKYIHLSSEDIRNELERKKLM